METHEIVRDISKTFYKFINVPHEGLGPAEQADMLNKCVVLNEIANRIEDGKEL